MAVTLEHFGIDRLPADERWELLGLLWDSLSEGPIAVPQSHIDVLERRIEAAERTPDDVISLAEARKQLLGEP